MSCDVGCKCGSDPMLLWLWCRPATRAPIRTLAWEIPYAMGMALKRKKKKKEKKEGGKKGRKEGQTDGLGNLSLTFEFPEKLSLGLEQPSKPTL